VRRVLSRVEDLAAPTPRDLHLLAAAWIDKEAPGEWTQALMELGALICVPTLPRCPTCPLAAHCRARRRGTVAERPGPKRRPTVRELHFWAFWDETRAGLLLQRRPERGIWGGLWMTPLLACEATPGPFDRDQARALGVTIRESTDPLPPLYHALTHRRLLLHPLRVRFSRYQSADWERLTWQRLVTRGTPVALSRLRKAMNGKHKDKASVTPVPRT
jgi:A/G-specific adenine glycosylase